MSSSSLGSAHEDGAELSPIDEKPYHRQNTTIRLDNNSPISYLYLTFDTKLPLPRASEQSGRSDEKALPPCPDMKRYVSPSEWSPARKCMMLILSCIACFLTGVVAGAYSPPALIMAHDLGTSRLVVLVGITTYCFGFASAPMVLAPMSEVWGRKPIFMAAGAVFVIFPAICSVMTNIAGMLVCRFFQGIGTSVFSTVVGGVLADIWANHERNTPMALFAGSALGGTGAGPLVSAALIKTLGPTTMAWKWSFWVQVILNGTTVAAFLAFFTESRRCVILSKKAKALNQWYEKLETHGAYGLWVDRDLAMTSSASSSLTSFTLDSSDKIDATPEGQLRRVRWVVKEDEQRASLGRIVATSVKRPFHLLVTEPVIFCFSLWAAFSWGVLYLSFSVVPFLHGNDFSMSSRVYVAMMIASTIAPCVSILQEKLLKHPQWRVHEEEFQYSESRLWAFLRTRFPAEAPESRLYFSCFTATLLPIGLFIAFMADTTGRGYTQAVGLGLAIWGIYAVYLATFNYLADSYHIYASSALAAQSFCRNILGGVFPLVTGAMFQNLGVRGAGAVLGGIATGLTVIPWVLMFYGQRIRSKSRVAMALQKN
ncbi:Major facilitator superfamily multidrug transporter NAG4-like protein [Cladobotryum mycophilum]|uniref:Major facilitator superfamily multidrug transporter NAG4-like protein n=1 Tax=Cladobotryum mycophilum TaxID=491253 RepID=A0ABR0SML8_9HYPO